MHQSADHDDIIDTKKVRKAERIAEAREKELDR